MGNIYDEQLKRMKTLMSYGINESTAKDAQSVVEYKTEGADGKTYGIIREGKKFYIKAAPKKDTEVLAEDFDYIGGFMNKKQYEYLTYPMASKQLELKLMSINEACNTKKAIVTDGIRQKPSEWQVNETKEMRAELNRFDEIVNNVDKILKEEKDGGFTMNHTLPEAPAKNPSDKKVNAPFVDTAVAKLDKDLKDTQTNPEKAGDPYIEDGEMSSERMKSDKTPKGNGGNIYSEKPQYVDTGIAGEHPKGGKVVRVESKNGHTVVLTEEQVLAWNKSKDFMDKTRGTVIGDGSPYSEEVNEDVIDVDDVAGMNDDDDSYPFPEVSGNGAYADFEQEYNDWLDSQDDTQNIDDFDELEFEIEPESGDDYDELDDSLIDIGDVPYEGRRSRRANMSEGTVLNDFGKHPAYRKQPMTTPPNVEINTFGRDWNDESTKGNKPYGSKIGSSAPYTEEVIDQLTDMVMKRINFDGKKKV